MNYLHKLNRFLGLHSFPDDEIEKGEAFHNPMKQNIFIGKDQFIIKGNFIDFFTNHIEDIDKMILSTETGNIAVHFPPHIGKIITQTIKKEEPTTLIIGKSKKGKFQEYPLYNLIAIQEPQLEIHKLKPQPSNGSPIKLQGFISDFRFNKDEFICGFILNNYLVDIPPHFGETMTSILNKKEEILVQGYKRNKDTGFINKSGLEIIRPYSLSINNTNYLL